MSQKKVTDNTLAFISEWKQRTEKQQKKYIILLVCSLLTAFILCALFFFWFQGANYDRIVDQNMKYIQDSALQEANQIEGKLETTVKLITNFSNQYAILLEEDESASTIDNLNALTDETLFDRIGFVLPDGTDVSLEGTCNIADRSYFKKAMSDQSGYEFIEQSRVTKKSSMVFYSPVKVDEKIVGVMIGFYETDKLDDLFSYQFFNYRPNSYLLDGNGLAIANSKDEYSLENILDKLSEKEFLNNSDYDTIKKAIDNPARTSITFSFLDNNSTSVGVISQFKNSDWMILSILPYDITETMINKANFSGINLMILIIITFLLLIVLFLIALRAQNKNLKKEMEIAVDNLKTAVEHDQMQSFIIESLGNAYSSVYYIDLSTGIYERITERENTVLYIPSTGKWSEGYGEYLENFVDNSYKEEMKLFYDIDSLILTDNIDEISGIEYKRKDQVWRRALMIPAKCDNDNNVTSVIFAVQKIDAEKKKEHETKVALQDAYNAAQLASNAKTTFLSNMSHDIRTPMNAIIGMTAIAAANLDNKDKVSDCLAKITVSSKHLLGLINEVLDMSKIESGKVDLNEEEFSLSKIIDELITINQPLIREKGHTLIVKTNNLIHENVIGDSTRLQQVFSNLLTNAIKYTPEGGNLEITVTEKTTNKSNVGWYEVVFKDNGIGMSDEFQKTLFEPFSRANDSRIKSINGTGLGMPIARNIIRMMNGDITLESKIDKGSKFTVSFALKLQQEEAINFEHFVDLPVLVVDDDIAVCESTCLILDSLSMKSEWVTSGKKAVDKAVQRHDKNNDYYAIIIDWKMPDMNGIETTREIRRRVGNDVPIIVISAYDWVDIEQEAKEAGVNAFLSKPLFKSKIVDLFSELTSKEANHIDTDRTENIKRHHFTGKRILLAEDNELNREIAVELLSMMDLKIETAEDGKECYEKFVHSEPGYYDMILMDIQMPFMNGYEASMAIRSSEHPKAKSIPILAMTANAFSTDVRKAFDSGMNGHLSKPIDIDIVIKALEEHL